MIAAWEVYPIHRVGICSGFRIQSIFCDLHCFVCCGSTSQRKGGTSRGRTRSCSEYLKLDSVCLLPLQLSYNNLPSIHNDATCLSEKQGLATPFIELSMDRPSNSFFSQHIQTPSFDSLSIHQYGAKSSKGHNGEDNT